MRANEIPYQIIFCSIIMLFTSCVTEIHVEKENTETPIEVSSTVNNIPSWLWDSIPSQDSVIFIASSPKLSSKKKEMLMALKNASVQAGVFSGFWGTSQDFILSNQFAANFSARTRAYYDGAAADESIDKFKAKNKWHSDEGLWVRFFLKESRLPLLNWQIEYFQGEPTWLHSPPEISGWIVAVGFGGKQSTLAKAILQADTNALADLIQQIHGQNDTVSMTRTQSTQGSSQTDISSLSYAKGFGSVHGFIVIARWYNSSGAWSLAVAPQSWNPEGR